MCLLRLLFWCAALLVGNSRHSRFDGFNSRLGENKFPFSRCRELTRNQLICLAVFGAKSALFGNNRKNSRSHGKNREFRPEHQRPTAAIVSFMKPSIAAGSVQRSTATMSFSGSTQVRLPPAPRA